MITITKEQQDSMQNKEYTVISIGLAAIGCIGYFFHQRHKESTSYKAKKQFLIDICQIEPVPYSKLKEHPDRTITGLIRGINKYKLEPTTYKKFIRHVSNTYSVPNTHEDFQEHQCGGSFTAKQPTNNLPIEVHLNDCHIQQKLLSTKRVKNIIFDENKDKESFSYSITHSLLSKQTMAIYGTITYSLTKQKWIVFPQFMVSEMNGKDAIKQMISYWENKIEVCKFIKYALAMMGCTVAYLLIYRPLKNVYKRFSNKYVEVSKGELDYFKLRQNFGARKEGALNCEKCKANPIRIIYECGHLAYCQECHQKAQSKDCPICRRGCKRFLKIFI